MKKLIPGRGNAAKRAANITNTAGRRRKNEIAMSMTNTQQAHPCINANIVLALTRVNVRAIANNTWKRPMVGLMSDPRTMANRRKIRQRKPHQHLRSRLQFLMLQAQNLVRHLAPISTVVPTASHHPSMAQRTRVRIRPSIPHSWISMTDSRRSHPTSGGMSHSTDTHRAAHHRIHRPLIASLWTQGL